MILSIQYLRAAAATMVVLYHVMDHVRHHTIVPEFTEKGAAGVDLFFVISGVIMWHTTANSTVTPAEFMRRRIERIVPTYWFVTLAMFMMPFVSGTIAGGVIADPVHLMTSLFFIPHETPGDPARYYPTYTPGWTINFEMYFYAVFGLCLFIKNETYRLLALGCTFLTVVLAGRLWQMGPLLHWYTSPILLEFAIGAAIAAFFASGKPVPLSISVGAIVAGLVALALVPDVSSDRLIGRVVSWGVPAILVVFGGVFLDRHGQIPKVGVLKFFGDASYSLYLTHLFAVGATAVIWSKFGLWTGPAGIASFIAAALTASFALASVFYTFVERPLLLLARSSWQYFWVPAVTGRS